MQVRSQRIFVFVFLLLLSGISEQLVAQVVIEKTDSLIVADSSKVRIAAIAVKGNKRTKDYIIRREMQFAAGDSIRRDRLTVNFLQARNQIHNTNLFTEVKIDSVYDEKGDLAVNVTVREKWYIYPTPEFRLADRSLNEWIKVYNADLNRVVYGAKFVHYNFTGRRDVLRLYLLNGYARNFSFSYFNPYSNRALTQGFGVAAGYTQNREIPIRTTINNKQVFYKSGRFVRRSANAGLSITKREGFFKTASAAASLTYNDVADSVIFFNPSYFGGAGRTRLIPTFAVGMRYLNTNNNNYPLKGKVWGFGVSKTGLGLTGDINMLSLSGDYTRYIPHGKEFYSAFSVAGLVKLPFEQAFINRRALGFGGFFLRGLDNYVIDGVAAVVTKYTFSKKILAFDIPVPFRIKALPKIPIKIFAKTFADLGYSYLPKKYEAKLNNKMLYTGGFGIDILTLYDINLRFDYSFNQLGEKGLFLRGSGGF